MSTPASITLSITGRLDLEVRILRYWADRPEPGTGADWLVAEVEVTVQARPEGASSDGAASAEETNPAELPPATGTYRAVQAIELMATDLQRLEAALAEMDRTLEGEAALVNRQGTVRVRVQLSRGRGWVSGSVSDETGAGEVRFKWVPFDQDDLRGLLEQTRRAIEAFPVRGDAAGT